MTFRDRLDQSARAKARELGRKLTYFEFLDLADGAHRESAKERKKATIDDRAQAVFNLYPNRQGGLAALKAITASIAEDGFDLVLERTTQYANAVARWPRHYRYSQHPDSKGKDMVPHASTWFNQRRYRDDPETWKRVGDAPLPKQSPTIPEPDGWRIALDELYPDNKINRENVPWKTFISVHPDIWAIVSQKLKATA